MTEELLAYRDTEMFALGRAVTAHRVVVLTGQPGIGKSALAAALVRQKKRGKPESAFLCSLEGARSTIDVAHELARALGIPTAPGVDVAERTTRALASRKRAVIVLDGVDRCRTALLELVPQWAAGASSVCFVLTARGRVGIRGEHRIEIGPLDVPPPREKDPDAIMTSAAVQLFVKRAATARPGFRLSSTNARTVASIVRSLEGVPLAIELCASRLLALSEQDIAGLLNERLDLLEDERAARSIRSAFGLSWDELSTDDAKVLAACSTFRGGFLLDAACAVVHGAEATSKNRVHVARSLSRLVEASLVRIEDEELLGVGRRYYLSETLRAFAAEKLGELGTAFAVEERHVRHYSSLRTMQPAPSLDIIAAERQNLEEAFDRALRLRADRGAAALLAYAPVALARGPLGSFVDRIESALALLEPPPADRAALLLSLGLARIFQGKRDEGVGDLENAYAIAHRAGAQQVEALALSRIAVITALKGDVDRAIQTSATAWQTAQASGQDLVQGIVLKDLANILSEAGRNDDAIVELGRARKFFRSAGDVREEGFVLMMLGSRFVDDGLLGEGRRDLVSALSLLRQAGDRRSECWALGMLSLVDAEEGDLSSARRHLDVALDLIREVGDEQTEGLLLGYLGNVALEQGLLEDAETAYRDGIVRVARAGDNAAEGLMTAAAAVVEHALGRVPTARDGFVRARKLLEKDGRAARRDAVEILATIDDPQTGQPGFFEDAGPAAEEIRFARRILGALASRKPARTTPDQELLVASDGSWVRTASGRVTKLGAGRPTAFIVHRLAVERVRHPGRPVPPQTLVRAGWPNERVLPAAAKNRLHVTIARLRRVGLEAVLLHDDDGYFFDPKQPTRVADPGETPPRR